MSLWVIWAVLLVWAGIIYVLVVGPGFSRLGVSWPSADFGRPQAALLGSS